MMHRPLALLIATALALASTGCFSPHIRKQRFPGDTDCTTSRVRPALDLVAGATWLGVAGWLATVSISEEDEFGRPRSEGELYDRRYLKALGVYGAALGGLATMVIGGQNARRVHRCRDAVQRERLELVPTSMIPSKTSDGAQAQDADAI